MLNLKYKLVIEATEDPEFFSFYSPDLQGFTGVGCSIENCITQAISEIDEHLLVLKENDLPIPMSNPDPTVTIKNSRRIAEAA
ncbi:type II toxin-antitoxin system HicB family antitoxin [Chromatium okenii]|jgi:predicted RNase H-like HicB family nuclease|uniref:HicB family protein n=1 Tax=Chromatium okenii TaxID=61644 RepID=A0A2S7XRK8_9GAMM|nr:HicB family protein [Chromatium okenii]MBV5308392.1 type II toxin-antitoxin system HicB family antitoxin [Chromatium okenii]PQJ95838.1 HicB family protein [Chromatium okenii]PQJ96369.1 HicB family protein [Chromatium okenii]